MKNYYEILEVNKNASKEIIEKAYKVLAKRNHPDLNQENKKEAEEKMKLINEAYEILSDDEKRKEYDNKLDVEEQERIRKIQYETENNYKNTQNSKRDNNEYNHIEVNTKRHYTGNGSLREEIQEILRENEERQRQYQQEQEKIYRRYLKSLGYKVKEKWTWKKFFNLLKLIGIFIIICFILWIFPPTHKMLIETYEENKIIQVITNSVINILKGLGIGICTFIKDIFRIN